jgi:hypothetical protein
MTYGLPMSSFTALRLVRQYTYRDYCANLSTRPQAFTDAEHVLRKHVGAYPFTSSPLPLTPKKCYGRS